MQYLTNFSKENSKWQNFLIFRVWRKVTTVIAGLKLAEEGDIYQGYFKIGKYIYAR